MARNVAIGIQSFEDLIKKNCFYVDKTLLVKEWWESNDSTTLITRPRRFGKTLNMSMLECFFLWIMQTGATCLKGLPSGGKKNTAPCRAPIR